MTDRRSFLVHTSSLAAAGSAALVLPVGARATQGVSKGEIVVGSIQDLSGPIASLGKPVQNGMILRAEQINAQGGINGRKIKLVVEDSGYDPKKGVLAAQKLVNQDKIFAMVATMGSPVSLATLPICLDKSVLHLFPITAHTGNFEPYHKLKFSASNPYPNTTRIGLNLMMKRGNYKRVGIIYQDDEYGQDVVRGTEAALKDLGLALVEKTSYKRGATDFSSQMQKLKAANPDLIVLATIIRETIGAMATARQLGYTGDFFGSEAAYQPLVPKAGGKAVEGLYAVSTVTAPYRDDPTNSKALNDWMDAYKARFNEEPDLYSVYGWLMLDIFAKAVEKTPGNLTAEAVATSLEKNPYPRSFLRTPELAWSQSKRMGQDQARLSRVENGRWTNVTDYSK
ncbi:MAG: ABC transporter substrate-binding protein [Burkholderiaceae bacterium]